MFNCTSNESRERLLFYTTARFVTKRHACVVQERDQWKVRTRSVCLPDTAGVKKCVISGFRRDVDEIWTLLGYYAAYNGSSVQTFRDNLSVPSSRVKKSRRSWLSSWASWPLKMGPKRLYRITTLHCVTSQKSAVPSLQILTPVCQPNDWRRCGMFYVRFFANPDIHVHKTPFRASTLVYSIFPWGVGEA